MKERIVIVGAGHMDTAIILGLLNSGHTLLHVVDPDASRLAVFRERNVPCTTSLPPIEPADAVVLAMPPQAFKSFAAGAKSLCGHTGPVVSVMAGVQVATIATLLDVSEVVRSIPNTPSEVFKGMTVFFAEEHTSPNTVERATRIFAGFGRSVRVPEEALIDPSTALCGGGPAFVAFFADAMQRFGTQAGLDDATSLQITLQVLRGTADLIEATNKPALQICKEVMTPQGTTERGIMHLESCGINEVIATALGKSRRGHVSLGCSRGSRQRGPCDDRLER